MTDAQNYLRKYLESKNLINRLLDDIEQRTTTINAVCKPFQDADTQRTTGGNSAEDRLVQLIDFKTKKYTAIQLNIIICIQVEHSISRMPDDIYRTILYSKYIQGKSFRAIKNETGLYCMKVYRMHGEALGIYERSLKWKSTNHS
jgi:hypothetical protein